MMRQLLTRVYRSSTRDLVHGLRERLAARGSSRSSRQAPASQPTEAFLRSPEYAALMSMHLPYDGSFDLHEAQNETNNFRLRHHSSAARLGVFRWRGIQRHLDTILSLVARPGARVIDFGGAGGPLGLGSQVVDRLDEDAWGRQVPFHSLVDAGRDYDVVFSSHALEHIEDLDGVLASIQACLRPGGHLLLHVPAFSCERWRAGIHANQRFSDHVWTFGLGPEPPGLSCKSYLDVREKIAQTFQIEVAEYCGDDSIFIHARRAGD